ncbi:fructose-1,6-bisphosphatase [Ligilactobacillus ceti]|nr:fructose-1,6-bisphosphatase [Ligilactobacillus ceti]
MNFSDVSQALNISSETTTADMEELFSYSQKLMREKYPTKQAVVTELMNLEAILSLPKGTEHFVSDLHGEYTAFDHVLRNGSGNVKQKLQDTFGGRMTQKTIQEFATLIYYPEEKIAYEKQHFASKNDLDQWYLDIIVSMLEFLQVAARKYTRSKVRKALDPNFTYITEELLYTNHQDNAKRQYINRLLQNLVALEQADEFIIATAYTIQRLVVDHLHVIGDVYDRGEAPEKIMDRLMEYHSIDIQWGNHDLIWLGAISGSKLSLLNILRICARYNNLSIIEDAYGINLRHLSKFAEENYQDNPAFRPKLLKGDTFNFDGEQLQITQIHQAVAMMQFKLEGHIIARRPEFKMESRGLLDKIDYEKQTIKINGKTYPLENTCFATIDPKDPYKLTAEEEEVINNLLRSVSKSPQLRRHLDFMMEKGNMYKCYNGNLLIHGCMPVDEKGNFKTIKFQNKAYTGQKMMDFFEEQVRIAYAHPEIEDDFATDVLWYLWQGENSPLFGKKDMTTFERYFIADKKTHHEEKNPYFKLRHDVKFCEKLLSEFGLDPKEGHIINGHTPVKKGHEAIMADGKMIVIDGGYSKAYQATTGIGGYTLLYNSYGLQLVAHHPFSSKEEAIEQGHDIISTRRVINYKLKRKLVADTDIGKQLQQKVALLRDMLAE